MSWVAANDIFYRSHHQRALRTKPLVHSKVLNNGKRNLHSTLAIASCHRSGSAVGGVLEIATRLMSASPIHS